MGTDLLFSAPGLHLKLYLLSQILLEMSTSHLNISIKV